MDARARALELVEQWHRELRELLPADADIFDAHLHLGHDIDGMVGDYDQLLELMDAYGISRAFMFCLDEPDRHPSFTAANDRTLAFAERSNGRLIPFVRLDLNESPIEEARRCLDAGAKGIKLHPRAQKFTSTDERLGPVFELAAERRVPILIHAGRGLPPIADGLRSLVERNPGATLILAHAGIADMQALAACMRGRKGVFFDTSTWSPVDLLDFYRQVPPEQVLYASDYPYGQQPSSLLLTVKTAIRAGLRRRPAARDARRERERARRRRPSCRSRPSRWAPTRSRCRCSSRASRQYLSMATPLLWSRQADQVGVLGLAINTCAERNGHGDEVDKIRELLEAARDLWATVPEIEEEVEARQTMRLTHRLVHMAQIEAITCN